jgi:NADPH:quinone reductase-like Zn-dependent oxidoreductase
MNAAIIEQAGAMPVYGTIADPPARPGYQLVKVTAASLSHVTKSRASGKHYSAAGGQNLVPGIDGTGILEDGRRVYFLLPESPHGSMAEISLVDPAHCVDLPDNMSDITAAAIAIPGMSSWAALRQRAQFAAGGTVLINGATGVSGGLAVQVAKRLGAKRVIATGRNAEALARLKSLGADVAMSLNQEADALESALEEQFQSGVDVVLDYLWGPSAQALLVAAAKAAPEMVPIRYVQIGSASGPDITLPSAVLRSSSIELLGSGINSVALPKVKDAIRDLFASASVRDFDVPVQAEPLRRVGEFWGRSGGCPRVVFAVGRSAQSNGG